jgi:hypothetical protein
VKNDRTKGHPVGEAVGRAGNASIGEAAEAVDAPVGQESGEAAAHDVAAAVEPALEDDYWSTHFQSRPYVRHGATYDEYRDAYRYGWESRIRTTLTWDEAVTDLEREWDEFRDRSGLAWQDAREAVRDAWNRVGRSMTGDADRDGR